MSRRSHNRLDEPVMAHWDQYTPSRFEQRIIHPYAVSGGLRVDARQYDSSIPSSGALSVADTKASSSGLSSTASENVPSLGRSFGTMSTRTSGSDGSIASSKANSSVSGYDIRRPPAGVLQCSFAFLGCREEFTDTESWMTHSTSHLRSHRPPTRSQCPFCSYRWTSDNAWNDRLEHVAAYHRNQRISAGYRADHDLFRHLLDRKVVSFGEYQELERAHWCDGVGGVYMETHSPRRERREGAPRGWTSYRVGG